MLGQYKSRDRSALRCIALCVCMGVVKIVVTSSSLNVSKMIAYQFNCWNRVLFSQQELTNPADWV